MREQRRRRIDIVDTPEGARSLPADAPEALRRLETSDRDEDLVAVIAGDGPLLALVRRRDILRWLRLRGGEPLSTRASVLPR